MLLGMMTMVIIMYDDLKVMRKRRAHLEKKITPKTVPANLHQTHVILLLYFTVALVC